MPIQPNLFDQYSDTPAFLTLIAGQTTTDPNSGVGTLQVPIPTGGGGRFLVNGNIWLENRQPGDTLTTLSIKDVNGILSPAQASFFPNYPTLVSSLDLLAGPQEGIQYFPKSGMISLQSFGSPYFVLSGLFIVASVLKANPSGVSDTLFANITLLEINPNS